MKLILTSVLFALATPNAKQIMTNVFEQYNKAKGLEIAYTVIKDGKQTDQGTYSTNGDDYYSESNESTSLYNSTYFIRISKTRKQIMVSLRSKTPKQQTIIPESPVNGMNYTVVEQKPFTRIKSAIKNSSGITEMYYTVDERAGILKKIEYVFKMPKSETVIKTTMNYTRTEFDKTFDKNFFSENRILKKTRKGFEITNADFKGYTIIDLTK